MKKTIIFLTLALALYLTWIFSENKNNLKPGQVDIKMPQEVFKTKTSNKSSNKLLEVKNINTSQKDINKMLPCAALTFLSDSKAPWQYLKANQYKSYRELKEKLIKTSLDPKGEEIQIIYAKMDKLLDAGYLPYLEDLYFSLKSNKKNLEFTDILNQKIMGSFDLEESIEALLVKAKVLREIDGDKETLEYLKFINEREGIVLSSSFIKEKKSILSSATTPSEIAAAMETISRLPSLDFTFLLELKNKFPEVKYQKIFDQISQKLIRETLESKDPHGINYLSYDIAIRLHSKGEALEKRYGTRDQVVKKFLKEKSSDNSETCDDRELIDLCDKYCSR